MSFRAHEEMETKPQFKPQSEMTARTQCRGGSADPRTDLDMANIAVFDSCCRQICLFRLSILVHIFQNLPRSRRHFRYTMQNLFRILFISHPIHVVLQFCLRSSILIFTDFQSSLVLNVQSSVSSE